MRLLIVSDFYPPLIGGATRSAQMLAQHLRARGHDVTVATSWQKGAPTQETDELGVQVHRLNGLTLRLPALSANPYRSIPPPFPDPETTWRFRRLIKAVRPELVHLQGWLSYSCSLAMTGLGIPAVLSARDYGNVCAINSLFRYDAVCSGPAPAKCLACATRHYRGPKGPLAVGGVLGGRSLLRRHIRGRHAVSSYVQDVLERDFDAAPDTVRAVIPDFRDESGPAAPDDEVLSKLPSEPFILFVGALRHIKGLDQLFAAYRGLEAPPPLVLIGTRAPDTPATFPEGTVLIENVPHATVMAAWDRALFGVAPSILPEPLGNVVHEAMSRGKPVIGTVPGGHADMIDHEETGLLVPGGDVEALRGAMERMLADPDWVARMGEAARGQSERFSAEHNLPLFERFYRDVVEQAA